MKKMITLLLAFLLSVANATPMNPLLNIKSNLDNMLAASAGRKKLQEMKKIANENNTDIDIAFDNYMIAKKNVSAARASFSPISTGNLLSISLGLGFLWAPIAAEAILSIPTKIYNVSKNKYLKKASLYNLSEAKNTLNNELAHLYYDILTHEVLIKTIDQEMKILTFRESKWIDKKYPESRMIESQRKILSLDIERSDLYAMYKSEIYALNSLISSNDNSDYELEQIPLLLNKSLIAGIDQSKLQVFALANSNKYKVASNLESAYKMNVKQVKWSLLSWGGLNLSYGKRVKVAKNEKSISVLNKDGTELEVKMNALLQLQKLDSSLDVFNNYKSISDDSLKYAVESYESYQNGVLDEDNAIEASLNAIYDFRSKVVAHYRSWSALSDLSTSVNFDFKADLFSTGKTAAKQIEENFQYKDEQSDYKIVKTNFDDYFTLSLRSSNIGNVSKVHYISQSDILVDASSDNGRDYYSINVDNRDVSKHLSGKAIVKLDNGQIINVSFNL